MSSVLIAATSPPAMSRSVASPDADTPSYWPVFMSWTISDELAPTFTRVAQELHSQYILGFSPETLDGKVHKLEVRLKRPGMVPRARKSYVATRIDVTQK